MQINFIFPTTPPPEDLQGLQKYTAELATAWGQQLALVIAAMTQGLTLGDGTDADNIAGEWVEITTHVTPGTEFAVTHNLGEVPVGFLLLIPPASGVINKGSTAWTSTTIYLSCTSSSQTAKLFLLSPPYQYQ